MPELNFTGNLPTGDQEAVAVHT